MWDNMGKELLRTAPGTKVWSFKEWSDEWATYRFVNAEAKRSELESINLAFGLNGDVQGSDKLGFLEIRTISVLERIKFGTIWYYVLKGTVLCTKMHEKYQMVLNSRFWRRGRPGHLMLYRINEEKGFLDIRIKSVPKVAKFTKCGTIWCSLNWRYTTGFFFFFL